MQVAHHRLRPLVEHMRIDLRRRNVGVPKQVLDDAKIRAVLQKVAGESVTQGMGTDVRGGEAGGDRDDFQFAREDLTREMAALAGSEIGASRSLPPLPRTAISGWRALATDLGSERSSDTRRPEA
jgi:hypothetical protein